MSKLYVVPTPIGKLEDFTFRAQRVLNEVDLILAEDTSNSAKLLSHYSISTPMLSNHMHNEHRSLQKWIDKIVAGESIALISDAGTPAISDPGFLLVRECIKNNIELECLPGATAFVPALVNSGIGCEKFVFEGFLPTKKGRQTRLKLLALENRTMIFYESPYRVLKTLNQLVEYMGENRNVSVSREITKKFEEHVRGSLVEVIKHFEKKEPKGEFVIILEGKKE